MYLFQQFILHLEQCLQGYLHSTMYLFQPGAGYFSCCSDPIYIPLCIYFNSAEPDSTLTMYSFTFHYVSISTTASENGSSDLTIFTFHYVSISTHLANMPYRTRLHLHSFHYVSISTYRQEKYIRSAYNLHPTMYLFQPGCCRVVWQ